MRKQQRKPLSIQQQAQCIDDLVSRCYMHDKSIADEAMGGTPRFAEPGSVGLHKSSFSDNATLNVADAVSEVQQMTAKVIAYMTEMGIDPALLQMALSYESNDIRFLSGSEMERYHLAITGTKSNAEQAAATPGVQVPATEHTPRGPIQWRTRRHRAMSLRHRLQSHSRRPDAFRAMTGRRCCWPLQRWPLGMKRAF
jgi:hypothetical protein